MVGLKTTWIDKWHGPCRSYYGPPLKAYSDARRSCKDSLGKRTIRFLSPCLDVAKDFVSQHNVGADSWRRTGVYTFDGNTRLPRKVTYERIRQHLIKVYNRHFSYGSVAQLCVARNKRRISSKRYHGVAKVTTRWVKYNPDAHWSAAFHKGLNEIKLVDGRDMCFMNRDDARFSVRYVNYLQAVRCTNCGRTWCSNHKNRLCKQVPFHVANHLI